MRDLQSWLDNTMFHHRFMANGPLWLLCPLCRRMRAIERQERRP